MVQVTADADGNASFDAFQVSKQCMEMVAEGALDIGEIIFWGGAGRWVAGIAFVLLCTLLCTRHTTRRATWHFCFLFCGVYLSATGAEM